MKRPVAPSLLSFDSAELDGAAGPGGSSGGGSSIAAATAARFEKEEKVAKKARVRASPKTSGVDPGIEQIPLRPLDGAGGPGAGAHGSSGAGGGGHSLPDDESAPLIVARVARARGGRNYMEDREVIIDDLGTLQPRLSGVRYLCVLDGHGGSRCCDFMATVRPQRPCPPHTHTTSIPSPPHPTRRGGRRSCTSGW